MGLLFLGRGGHVFHAMTNHKKILEKFLEILQKLLLFWFNVIFI